MQKKTIAIIGTVVLSGAAVLAGTQLAGAGGETEDEGPDVAITGADLDAASAAALAHTGEGQVTETEVGDEESYYEVEVTLDDGSEVDVQLDEAFDVVGSETEDGTEDGTTPTTKPYAARLDALEPAGDLARGVHHGETGARTEP